MNKNQFLKLSLQCKAVSRSLLAIYLSSLVPALLPLQISSLQWYMRIINQSISGSSILLVAILCNSLERYFSSNLSNDQTDTSNLANTKRIALYFFSLAIILQITFSFLLFFNLNSKNQLIISSAEKQTEVLHSQINDIDSQEQFNIFLKRTLGSQSFHLDLGTSQDLNVRKSHLKTQLGRSLYKRKQEIALQLKNTKNAMLRDTIKIVSSCLAIVICLLYFK